MATMTVNKYMEEISRSCEDHNGKLLAELLGFKHPHIASRKLQLQNASSIVNNWFEEPLSDLVNTHLKAVWAVANNDYYKAYQAQVQVCINFNKFFGMQKDENWSLPALFTTLCDLRLFAIQADDQRAKAGKEQSGDGLVEKAAEPMMGCFRTCVGDTRAALEVSKKWGIMGIVNQLIKIYFRINKLQLLKPLVRSIDNLPFKDDFNKSHLVTYRFLVGKKAMFDSDYKLADEYLTYAFEHCHRKSKKNKKTILTYLLPVKMQRGKMPTQKLLKRYDLVAFTDVKRACIDGDLLLLNQALEQHANFFIKAGIYLILEKLKVITYRNLFKKTALLMQTHQISIEAFRIALHHMGETDVDTDEVHCILANLIYDGYLKGYISYQHQKLIVSKQKAFPVLTTFL